MSHEHQWQAVDREPLGDMAPSLDVVTYRCECGEDDEVLERSMPTTS